MRSEHGPRDAARLFARVGAPWWIAGGHAIDLLAGRTTRPHEDLDVAILRRDFMAFRGALAGWDLHAGRGGGVVEDAPLVGAPPPEVPAVWCRPSPEAPWAFELLLGQAEGDAWVFPRDARVRRPLAEIGFLADGLPVLRPEIVLLFKAKAARAVDEADLEAALPWTDAAARAWLAAALDVAHPGHPWARRVRA